MPDHSPEVERAIMAVVTGEPVVVIDDDAAPPQGMLAIAPAAMDDAAMELFLTHTVGVIRVAATEAHLHSLGIAGPEASVSLASGPPPASARGRAAAIRALAGGHQAEFARPGHVFVVQAQEAGVLQRPALVEAAVDLVRMAGRGCAVAVSEVSSLAGGAGRGELAGPQELRSLAATLNLPAVTVADLVAYQLQRRPLVERVTETELPTRAGTFRCIVYRDLVDDREHLALVVGEIQGDEPVLARVQRSFPLDELLLSGLGAGRSQLETALERLSREGRGALVYLRPYPDLGAGLVTELQDRAVRLEAQPQQPFLGFDDRQHGIGAQILADLGLRRLRLLTDHPRRHRGISGFGLEVVEYVPLTESEPAEWAETTTDQRTVADE